ncbi:hypothetical protein BDV93DRAFT_511581 [Ceratobasidium sp. AG-I]|nr:hypothetical protein BDV93DRAFT_511581 [Ceratobasidium sp. AG-I]
MIHLATLSLCLFSCVLSANAQFDNRPFSDSSKSMSDAVKAIIGVFVGIFCVIVIFYISMFFYLRKHGRNWASLLRRRRGFGPSMYGPQGPNMFDNVPPSAQQQGAYNPYAEPAPNPQGPRMPDPVHNKEGQYQQGQYNAPDYPPPKLLY